MRDRSCSSMRSARSSGFALVLAALSATSATRVHGEDAPLPPTPPPPPATATTPDIPNEQPVVDSPAGIQAFNDVRGAYASGASSVARSREAAGMLGSKDAPERSWAAEYLVALFRQTRFDQENGRTPRGGGMKLGPGPQDDGASIRWIATRELEHATVAPGSTDALGPALWLWREGRTPRSRSAAMALLIQIRHGDADAAIVEAVKDDDAPYDVLERALTEVALRNLTGVDDAVRVLCLHHVLLVREAATSAAKALSLKDVPAYTEDGPFVPSLAKRVRAVAERFRPVVPPDAKWVRIRLRADPKKNIEERDAAGWRLPDRGPNGWPHVVDWWGRDFAADPAYYDVADQPLAETGKRLIEWRTAFDAVARDDHEGRWRIERRMGLEPWTDSSGRTWVGTSPEALVAAWAYDRGDRATARAVLLPLLEKAGDEAPFFADRRDEQARPLDEQMLEAFRDVDYPHALALAKHLASPLFDGWHRQDRAKELVEEIPRRSDDWKALTLPTPAEWKEQAASTSRADVVAFLAARLRLIRAWQEDIPGGISFGADQFLPGVGDSGTWTPFGRDRVAVINPYDELLSIDLSARDVMPVLPLLSSRDHILAFDLERFGHHWPQTFFRVAWVAAKVLDAVAGESIVDRDAVRSGDAAKAGAEIERLRAWFLAHGDEKRSDRLVAAATSKPWEEADRAFRALIGLAPEKACRAAAARAASDAEHRSLLARLVGNVGGKEQLDAARGWAKDPDATIRFFGAWILVRHGDRAKREGVDDLLAGLREPDGWKRRDAVLDDLMASGDAVAKAYVEAEATSAAARERLSVHLLGRRARAGDAAAIDAVLAAFEGKGTALIAVTPGDDRDASTRSLDADGLANAVLSWRTQPVEFPWGDDEEAKSKRAARREEVVTWLRGQRALLAAGKPAEIRPTEAPRLWGEWGWISSGWVRRM